MKVLLCLLLPLLSYGQWSQLGRPIDLNLVAGAQALNTVGKVPMVTDAGKIGESPVSCSGGVCTIGGAPLATTAVDSGKVSKIYSSGGSVAAVTCDAVGNCTAAGTFAMAKG